MYDYTKKFKFNPCTNLYFWTHSLSMTVIYFMTGATLFEAGIVALVEPAINGVWFYILHSLWRKLK